MSDRTQYNDSLDHNETVVVASGQTLSGAFDTMGMTIVGVRFPAALTGTSFNLQAAPSLDGTYVDCYDADGNLIAFTAAASRHVVLNPQNTAGLQFIKLKSNSSEGADRTITLVLRAL